MTFDQEVKELQTQGFVPLNTLQVILRIIWFLALHPLKAVKIVACLVSYKISGPSFLDTDFYKLTMLQFIFFFFPQVAVEYQLTVRSKVEFPDGFAHLLQSRLEKFAKNNTSISANQRRWLEKTGLFRPEFLNYLADEATAKLSTKHLTIIQNGGDLSCTVSGPWRMSSPWEIPLMHQISELYYEQTGIKPENLSWLAKAANKARAFKFLEVSVAEFGSRRRRNFWTHVMVLLAMLAGNGQKTAQDQGGISGTSNVLLAQVFDLKPIGTMAHELFMVLGALFGYEKANRLVIHLWHQLYGKQLNVVLPDTYTSEAFFAAFSNPELLQFAASRQDSGVPEEFATLQAQVLQKIGWDVSKNGKFMIVYSDSLASLKRIAQISSHTRQLQMADSYGIGTWLTNDVSTPSREIKPLNIVVKPLQAKSLAHGRWVGCAKISDTPGKITGDSQTAEAILRWINFGDITWAKPPLEHEWTQYTNLVF